MKHLRDQRFWIAIAAAGLLARHRPEVGARAGLAPDDPCGRGLVIIGSVRMLFWPAVFTLALSAGQAVERQPILTITSADIDNGVLSEITWDHGALHVQ